MPAVLQRHKIGYKLSVDDKKAQHNVTEQRQWLQNIYIQGVYKTLHDQS